MIDLYMPTEVHVKDVSDGKKIVVKKARVPFIPTMTAGEPRSVSYATDAK